MSISSIRAGAYHDPTCLLYAGDHHPSFVRYQLCRVEEATKLEAGVRDGFLVQQDPMDGEIIARILTECLDSRHTALEIKTLVVEQGWVIVDDAS